MSLLKWTGTISGLLGALIIALNLPFVWIGFILFLISSVSWTTVGFIIKDSALMILNGTFVVINVVGIIRWF